MRSQPQTAHRTPSGQRCASRKAKHCSWVPSSCATSMRFIVLPCPLKAERKAGMPELVNVGYMCTCGSAVAVPGIEPLEAAEFETYRHKAMLESWQKIVQHPGCSTLGFQRPLTPDRWIPIPLPHT